MDVSITGRALSIGDSLRTHIEESLQATVGKYFAKAVDASVIISREAHRFRADITVHPIRSLNVKGRAADDDAYLAFDAALERIAKQLRRYKRRLNDHHRYRASEEGEAILARETVQEAVIAPEPVDDELPADGQPVIIAEMQTEIHTLSVSEAVMRMDLADVPALVFRNQTHGGLNVVFRRADGNIGWIDPHPVGER
jgi:ribosomal subunit interface protein